MSLLLGCTLGRYSFLHSHSHNNYCLKYKQAYSTRRKYKLKKESLNNKQLMCFCLHTSTYAHTHICTYTHTHTYRYTHTHAHTPTSMESWNVATFVSKQLWTMLLRITLSPLRLFTQQEWEDIQNTSRDHVLLLYNSNFLRDLHS